MTSRRYGTACIALIGVLAAVSACAQPSLSFEIKKPQKYENREFPSEKSSYTKFSYPKRLYNNTVSRFNYYFNANNILNEVIAASKQAHVDDYTQLLPFYNYQLSTSHKDRMDSVIYKTTAGIVLHDLRSDWVDKLYLLMGKAYLLRKDFDSATNVFQYINYAFAPKDGGYDLPIGSNASNTNGVFTIATREKRGLWKKMTSFPPSRNESFLWQVRTYIEQDALVEASSLVEIIRVDPNFPERLRIDLEELTAYLFYRQQNYGAAAMHLEKALPNAEGKYETARWEYLAAQLYQLAGNDQKSAQLYEKAIQHTTDPVMEVYARLNTVSLAASAQENAIQRNLDELLKMARRDKYETQRDIIYYAAAQLELKRKNYDAAQALLLNSIRYNTDNTQQRQLSFLLLGDLNYTRRSYSPSYRYYDSIQAAQLKEIDQLRVTERKPALQVISQNQDLIIKEDSLQKLAGLSVDERNDLLKKILRDLRRAKGLKDIPADAAAAGSPSAVDLFAKPSTEFYFQNTSLRARGLGEFKSRWGNRPNVDNWRRQGAVDRTLVSANPAADANSAGIKPAEDLSIESLLKNIPLTGDQVSKSNQAIIKALLDNAHTFQNKLEDYPSAIETYEELLRRYPESAEIEDVLYNLAFVYNKNNQPDKATAAAAQLKRGFPTGTMASQVNAVTVDKKNDPAQQTYETVYQLFLEGKWAQAKEAKQAADKKFGKNYWTPQLLYIESIYYIKQKEDTVAIDRLQNITSLFAGSPLAAKAATMIDVLKRRKEIESYLTNLDVNKPEDQRTRLVDLNNTNVQTISTKRPDSLTAPKEVKAPVKDLTNIANTNTLAVPEIPKKDSMPTVATKEITTKGLLTGDTKPKAFTGKGFSMTMTDTVFVVVMLDKVDPIFVTEARNAFNRFNQERFPDAQIALYNRKINDQFQFLLLGPFTNTADAVSYIDKVKPVAGTRIVPWLAAAKYNFSIISDANMNVLVGNQDVAGYREFLHGIFPDKF